jgi:hypothetical protein
VTAAWIFVAVLIIGLPLLAWWLGGRRFWARQEARDPAVEIMRRHGLTTAEAARVVAAVPRGSELEDPRMRAAAVELAQLTLAQVVPTWQDASTGRRVLLVLTSVWVLVVVANAAFAVAFGNLGDVSWFHLAGAAVIVGSPFWQSRRLRQTIALNAGPGPADGG